MPAKKNTGERREVVAGYPTKAVADAIRRIADKENRSVCNVVSIALRHYAIAKRELPAEFSE